MLADQMSFLTPSVTIERRQVYNVGWTTGGASKERSGSRRSPQRGPRVKLPETVHPACTSIGVDKLIPFLTDHLLLRKKTHQICINLRNTLWKKWSGRVHSSALRDEDVSITVHSMTTSMSVTPTGVSGSRTQVSWLKVQRLGH